MAGGIRQGKEGSSQTTHEERSKTDAENSTRKRREQQHDKTLEDSFPSSDPPSSIPDPCEEDSDAA